MEKLAASIKIEEKIDPLTLEWELLAERVGASPFLWPGWIGAWRRAFGSGRLEILTSYRDGQLTGVLPLQRHRGSFASPTNPHTPLFGLLAADETAARDLSRALFSQGAPHVTLSFLSSDDGNVPLARSAAEDADYRVVSEAVDAAPHISFDGTWDAYENTLRRKFKSELRRRRRRLEEEGELEIEVLDGTENLGRLLEEGFRVEGSGWKGAHHTSINSRPSTRRFYSDVARWAAGRGWLKLAFLRLDGRTIAFDYCLEYGGVHYLLKTGFDPAYQRFAPGMILRYLMISRAFSEGISTYDFLGISDVWKREWTNSHKDLLFVRMFAPTPRGRMSYATYSLRRRASKRLAATERGRRLLSRNSVLRSKLGR